MTTFLNIALFLAYTYGVAMAYLIGLYRGENRTFTTKGLAQDLRKSRKEIAELREFIWLVTTGDSSTQSMTKAGALPSSSVTVERSRHLNVVNQEGRE